MKFGKKGGKRVNSQYIIIIEGDGVLESKAYGPFKVEELKKFLEKINNKNLVVFPLREEKEYGN